MTGAFDEFEQFGFSSLKLMSVCMVSGHTRHTYATFSRLGIVLELSELYFNCFQEI